MPRLLCLCLLLSAGCAQPPLPVPSSGRVALNDISTGLDTHLVIGNGDLIAYVAQEGNDLVVGTSKNDVWDARMETNLDRPLAPITLIEKVAREGWGGKAGQEGVKEFVKAYAHAGDSYHAHPYPSPRMTARWRIPLPARIEEAAVGLDGTASIRLAGGATIRCWIHALRNVIVLEGSAAPALEPIADPELIPPAETGTDRDVSWLLQKLPDDLDVKGVSFAAASVGAGGRHFLAQATSLESEDPKRAALTLAREALAADPERLRREHDRWWGEYWSRSSVSLEDEHLEKLWYRLMYFMGTAIRPGKASPGLFAPLTSNKPAWHGDYHTNYNIQQTYWSALSANHPEMTEPYDRLILEYLPRARWLAKKLYGVGGAFYPHVIMFSEPPNPEACEARNGRQYLHIVWAYTLGVTSFTVQGLWWRYLYDPDPRYLKQVAYPALSETARFYADLLEKHRGADGKSRPPTISPEHWGWTAGLARNRNCTFDTAMIAFNLKAAAQAARILGRDAEEAKRWLAALDLLPPYPTHGDKDPVVVDVEGAPPCIYNIPVPATPVFPGEQVTLFSAPEEKDLFIRTIAGMKSNGNNDIAINSIARARLGMPDACEYLRRETLARLRSNGTLTLNRNEDRFRFNAFGHYTEMYGYAAAVTELLLQSVDGVLRVFPAWPEGKRASFQTLRAVGGFLVSSEYDGKSVASITIASTVGGECAVSCPWPGALLDGAPVRPDDRGIIRFSTVRNRAYTLKGPIPSGR